MSPIGSFNGHFLGGLLARPAREILTGFEDGNDAGISL